MTDRKETIARMQELAQDAWAAKYMLYMAAGYLTDVQLESVVQSELEVGEMTTKELHEAYKAVTAHTQIAQE